MVTGLVLAGILATTLAPAAEADRRSHRDRNHGHDRVVRYKRSHHGHGHGSTYVVRRSNAGPVIAGFLGGLFLGATLANAAPAGYDYYDPYCHERFASLDRYHWHLRRHRHPKVIRVVEVRRTTRYVERDANRDYGDDRYDRDDGDGTWSDDRDWERDLDSHER
jgi:hypothetical protein